MALSRITQIAPGGTNTFAVSFALGYGDEADVTARVGAEVDGLGAPVYRTIDFSTPGFMTLSGAIIAATTPVVFERTESRTALDVNWQDGANITDENLNDAQLQALRLIHEALDGRFEEITQDINMRNHSILNLATPTTGQSATTKDWVLSVIAGAGGTNVSAAVLAYVMYNAGGQDYTDLSQAIARYIPNYLTAGGVSVAFIPAVTNRIRTQAYAVAGDAGAAEYVRVSTAPGHGGYLTSADGAFWELQVPMPTINMFGAYSGWSDTTNSTAINTAIEYCRVKKFQRIGSTGTIHCLDNIVNQFGIEFDGPGIVVVTSTGKKVNRRVADKKGVFNFKAIWYAASQITTTGKVHILIHGDSTAVDGPTYSPFPFTPSNLLKKGLWNRGLKAVLVSNYAVSGTGLQDLAFKDLSNVPWFYDPVSGPFPAKGKVDIVVLKYGINDGILLARDRVAYKNLLRARLQTIRTQFGSLISIIIMSANVITDTYSDAGADHGRDEQWVEDILGIERAAALEFGCVHIDNFSAFKARDADDGFWMESLGGTYGSPYRFDAAVHPRSYYTGWMWGGPICDVIADEGMMAVARFNAYRWVSSLQTDYRPLMASLPSDYLHQGMEGTETLLTDDWGFVGAQRTEFPPNGIARQVAWQAGANPLGRIRHGSGGTWGSWFIEGTLEATPTMGAKFTSDAGSPIRVVKSGGGLSFEGGITVSISTIATGGADTVLTTPLGFRPRRQVICALLIPGIANIPCIWDTSGAIKAYPFSATSIAAPSYSGLVGTATFG